MASIAKLVVSLGANISDFETDMKRASRLSKRELAKMQRQADQLNKKWNSSFKLAGAAVGAGLALATKSALEFNKAMAEVSTLLDDTSGIEKTSKEVKALSVQFAGAPVDEAKALYQIISAGAKDSATQMEQLTVANKLAVGGVTDVATAADGLTSVLNAYEGTGLDANRVSDIMFETMRQGKTTIGELSANLGSVVTIAAQTGVSFEELGASVATVTGVGASSAQAMEGLRGVLAAVLKQSEQTKKAAKDLKIQFDVSRLSAVGLDGVLKDIANSGATEEQLSKLIGRVEGLTNLLANARNNGEAFAKNLDAITNSAGSTDIAVAKMMESAAFKADQAAKAFDVLRINIGEKLLASVSSLAVGFVKHLDTITAAIEALIVLITVRATVAIVAAFAQMSAAGATLATTMAFLGGPVGLAALALAGTALAMRELLEETTPLKDATDELEASIKSATAAMVANAEVADLAAQQATLRKQWVEADILLIEKEKELTKQQLALGLGTSFTEQGMRDLWIEVDQLRAAQDKALDTSVNMTRRMKDIAKGAEDAADATGNLGGETAKTDKATKRWVGSARIAGKLIQKNIEFVEEIEQAQNDYNQALQDFVDIGDPIGAIMREFETQVTFANAALKAGDITAKEYRDTLNALSNAAGQAAAGLNNTAKEADVMTEAMLEGVRILERTFTDLWTSIVDGSESAFDSILDGFQTLLAQMLHRLLTAPIIKQLENLVNGKSFNLGALGQGAAGIAGVAIGSELGGGSQESSIGSSLGVVVGTILTAKLGPLGQAIGKVFGGIVGGLFGKLFSGSDKLVLQVSGFSNAAASGSDDDSFVDTVFGRTFTRSRRLDAAAIEQFKTTIADFDNAIGSFLDQDQIGKVTDVLAAWSEQIEGETLTAEQLLGSRFAAILSTFSDNIQGFVNKVSDLQEQTERLQVGVGAEKLFAEVPELFGGHTINEFLGVVEAFQDGTETITDAFRKVVDQLVSVNTVINDLQSFGGSSLADEYDALVRAQSESVTAALTRVSSDFIDAIRNFDGSPEQLLEIGNLAQAVRLGEIQLLNQIDGIQKGINANLDRLLQDTLKTVNGPQAPEEILRNARDLIGAVANAETPEEVAAIAQQFEALIRSLSPEDTHRFGTTTLALIEAFQKASNTTLDTARQNALDSGEDIRKMADNFSEMLDPLKIIASTNEQAAAFLEAIAKGETPALDPVKAVDDATLLSDGINQSFTEGLAEQKEVLEVGAANMTTAIANGMANLSPQVAAAIANGFGLASINIVIAPETSLTTQ